ncbi:unnamed protein product [Malus baccata var. baccata]
MEGDLKTQTLTHHVAALAFPFGTHAGPLLSLVLRLAAAAPHVVFSFITTSKANTSLFSKSLPSSLPNVQAYDILDGLPKGFVPPRNHEVTIGFFLKEAPAYFKRALKDTEAATGLKIGCLVDHDRCLFMLRQTSFDRGLEPAYGLGFIDLSPSLPAHTATPYPRFVDIPTPISIFLFPGLVFASIDHHRCVSFSMSCQTKSPSEGYSALQACSDGSDVMEERLGSSDKGCNGYGVLGRAGDEEKSLDFLPGFSKVKIPDLPEGILGNSESTVGSLLYKMGQTLPKAIAVAINSFEELEPEVVNLLKSRFQKFLNVGPFSLITSSPTPPLIKDDSGCLEWLDKHKPTSVAYISFGSVVAPPPHELATFAQVLIETGFPFIWSFRGNIEDVLPKGFNKSGLNGKIVPWAPQVQVLGHASTGVFLTHCGWNSILESIVGGVPMICRPFFGDQKLNMNTIEAVWEIGVGIERGVITKNGVIKALELTLKHKEGNEMREKIKVLKNLAQQAVASNGSSPQAFNTLVEIVTK